MKGRILVTTEMTPICLRQILAQTISRNKREGRFIIPIAACLRVIISQFLISLSTWIDSVTIA